jgi:hypothetical protein
VRFTVNSAWTKTISAVILTVDAEAMAIDAPGIGMLTIAASIILGIVLLWTFVSLVAAMFSGFKVNTPLGCTTMIVFGVMLLGLAMCAVGG